MKSTEEELKEVLQQQTARSTPRQAECLTEDQFVRAAMGEMTEQERVRVAHHLVTCVDCTDEYRSLRALKSWADEAEQILAAPAASTVAGSSLRVADKAVAPTVWRRYSALSPQAGALALAASLLIVLGLAGWLLLNRQERSREIARLNNQLAERDRELASATQSLDEARSQLEEAVRHQEKAESAAQTMELEGKIAELRRTVDELSKPQVGVPIVDLDPSPATRGDPRGAATRIELPRTANFITLILNFGRVQTHSDYEVEILDHSGKRVWRGRGMTTSEANSLNLTLPRRLVPGGLYLVRIHAVQMGRWEQVAEYPVVIAHQ